MQLCSQAYEIRHLLNRAEMKDSRSISFEFYSAETSEWVGKHHVELTYDPIHFNAVTYSKDHIFVADLAPGGGSTHPHMEWKAQSKSIISSARTTGG